MMRFIIVTVIVLFIVPGFSSGAGKKISENGNKHNFSYTNLSANYRAIPTGDNPSFPRSQQICVFCHTPHHSSGDGPLWNRKATTVSFFKHYSSSTLAIDDAAVRSASDYGQPNGSSRLCLSCHDGVTALGAVFTTPFTMDGQMLSKSNIQFIDVRRGISGPNVTMGYETFSTHHPVSFKYNAAVRSLLTSPPYSKPYTYNPPISNDVRLDKESRMQCTTCHDPHQDKSDTPSQITPLWTTNTYDKVCQTCQ